MAIRTQQVIDTEELAQLFRRTTRMLARAYHRRDKAHHAQDHVLALLNHHGPMGQNDLLRILDVRSSSLSEVLGKLEMNGLIMRERNQEDRRSFVISVTEQGRAATGANQEPDSAKKLFACLDEAERGQLWNILSKLSTALDKDPERGEKRGHGKGRHSGRGVAQKAHGKGNKGHGKGRGQGRGKDQGKGHGKGR